MSEINDIAKAMMASHKGLLAADESNSTAGKRLAQINVENTEENRRAYRELLFTTPGVSEFLSGVILYEETLYQKTADGKPFVNLLKENGIIPGIKVDMGVKPLGGKNKEDTTQGLQDLSDRCAKYYQDGARFAKWRATYTIDSATGTPSDLAIEVNAMSLARYAAICQENNIVPIVEPEVLMDGHFTMAQYADVTTRVQQALYSWLQKFQVDLAGTILKPNMIIPSSDGGESATPEEIAKHTYQVLKITVPAEVPGIMFLSGGQSEQEATDNLQALNELFGAEATWGMSFSYGRALQASTLQAWQGKSENVAAAQDVFFNRCKAVSVAVSAIVR